MLNLGALASSQESVVNNPLRLSLRQLLRMARQTVLRPKSALEPGLRRILMWNFLPREVRDAFDNAVAQELKEDHWELQGFLRGSQNAWGLRGYLAAAQPAR